MDVDCFLRSFTMFSSHLRRWKLNKNDARRNLWFQRCCKGSIHSGGSIFKMTFLFPRSDMFPGGYFISAITWCFTCSSWQCHDTGTGGKEQLPPADIQPKSHELWYQRLCAHQLRNQQWPWLLGTYLRVLTWGRRDPQHVVETQAINGYEFATNSPKEVVI